MKHIIFCRHAKSSWRDLFIHDVDRPLNKRGKRDAPMMAQKLLQHYPHIELCVSSVARRAKDTARVFCEVMDIPNYEVISFIYEADLEDLLMMFTLLDDQYSSAICFGHNPSFTHLHNHFTAQTIDNLPTCGLFGLRSSAETWADIDTTNSKITFLLYPKMWQ